MLRWPPFEELWREKMKGRRKAEELCGRAARLRSAEGLSDDGAGKGRWLLRRVLGRMGTASANGWPRSAPCHGRRRRGADVEGGTSRGGLLWGTLGVWPADGQTNGRASPQICRWSPHAYINMYSKNKNVCKL